MRRITMLCLCVMGILCAHAQQRFDRGIEQHTFVPKGQWVVGTSVSYSEYSNDNYRFLVIEGIDGSGYSFKVSPLICFFFKDNLGAGGRFSYNRTLTKLDALSLDLGDDLDLDINDFYNLSHSFSTTGILRSYISIGDSKRFGLFNEVQLTGGFGQGKLVNGSGDDLSGTFEKKINLQIGMSPGLVAFVNNYTAIEVSIGVLGFNYAKTKQTTDQIYYGERSSSSANFRINLFSIGLGIAFYL